MGEEGRAATLIVQQVLCFCLWPVFGPWRKGRNLDCISFLVIRPFTDEPASSVL